MKKNMIIVAALVFGLTGLVANAALTFGTAVSVPNDAGSVFLNDGIYVIGVNVGNGGPNASTINGVTFKPGVVNIGAQTQVNMDNGVTVSIQNVGFWGNLKDPVYTATASYDEIHDVVESGFMTDGYPDGSLTISLSGLIDGMEYRMQTFHLWNNVSPGARDMVYTDGVDTSAKFSMYFTAAPAVEAAVANWVSFTAVGTTKTISLLPSEGGDRAYLNGLSLFSIPAPGTLGLVGLMGVAMIGLHRLFMLLSVSVPGKKSHFLWN